MGENEREEFRLEVLAATGLLDSAPEREFDTLVELACRLTGCKHGAISLIDRDRQWYKSERGLGFTETAREHAFCAVAIQRDEPLLIPDATRDARFARFPQVVGGPRVRFYAGVPLFAAPDRDTPAVPLGTLCVSDDVPRELSDADLDTLRDLTRLAEALVRPRFVAMKAAELLARRAHDFRELQRSQRQFRQAERMTGIGAWRMSLPDNGLEWSDGVFAIYGLPTGSAPSLEQALDPYPPQSQALVTAAVERAAADGTPFDLDLDFETAQGEARRVRTIGEIETIDGRPTALIGVFQDVTERHLKEQDLRRSAQVDELTGLTNRAGFNAALDARLEQARASGEPLALLLIDLDGFKAVNDRCGHLMGDEVLQAIAAKLARPHLAGCSPARLGGDEFVLLLDYPAGSTAFHAAVEALLADLRYQVSCDGHSLSVSGTIGISWFDGASSRRDLLNRADQALYAAKRCCPGTARVFGRPTVLGPALPCLVDAG